MPAEELFKSDALSGVNYETSEESDDEVAARLLSQIDWHPYERPYGALPLDLKNPAAYRGRRGSNLTLLAEREGFEPSNRLPRYILSRDAPSTGLGHLSNTVSCKQQTESQL